MNTVEYIRQNRPLSEEQKITAKTLGRPTPDLQIRKTVSGKTREFNRYFNRESAYSKFSWMCGCEKVNKLFCFVCLLGNESRQSTTSWVWQGVSDIQHLQERATKHEKSPIHLHNLVDYRVLGKIDIRQQLDPAYAATIRTHNKKVNKNRHLLRHLIMCIKFCGAFEFGLNSEGEAGDEASDVFCGLLNFASELDALLSSYLKDPSTIKATSKAIQNELLDAMLQVYREEILEQSTKSNYVAVKVNEVDLLEDRQFALVFRYVYKGELFERFWSFIQPESHTAEHIGNSVLKELEVLTIPADKLIAQTFDGVHHNCGSVPLIIKEYYPTANLIYCYSDDFNSVLKQAGSVNSKLRIFFALLEDFTKFFSEPQTLSVLDEIVKNEPTEGSSPNWDFKAHTITTLYENKELIWKCLEMILETETVYKKINEVYRMLTSLDFPDFNEFLEIFYYISPHVETFFREVHSPVVDNSYVQKCLSELECQIIEIRRSKLDSLNQETDDATESYVSKRPRLDVVDEHDILFKMDCDEEDSHIIEVKIENIEDAPETSKLNLFEPELPQINVSQKNADILKVYCDVLLNEIKNRYVFTGHLSAAALFSPDLINTYGTDFPEGRIESTLLAYPFLDRVKLKTELTVLYGREDLRGVGMLPLLTFMYKNELQEGLSETFKLLDVLCTTPMHTLEAERRFSTLESIKSFLKNTVDEKNLNALAMLSVEKKSIELIDDFDNKVIEEFASTTNRAEFNYQ